MEVGRGSILTDYAQVIVGDEQLGGICVCFGLAGNFPRKSYKCKLVSTNHLALLRHDI